MTNVSYMCPKGVFSKISQKPQADAASAPHRHFNQEPGKSYKKARVLGAAGLERGRAPARELRSPKVHGEVEEGRRVRVADGRGRERLGGLGAVGAQGAHVQAALEQLEQQERVERGERGPPAADRDELALLHSHPADGGAGAHVDGPVGRELRREVVGLLVGEREAVRALLPQRTDAHLHALGEAVAAQLGPVDADVRNVVGCPGDVGEQLRGLRPAMTVLDCSQIGIVRTMINRKTIQGISGGVTCNPAAKSTRARDFVDAVPLPQRKTTKGRTQYPFICFWQSLGLEHKFKDVAVA